MPPRSSKKNKKILDEAYWDRVIDTISREVSGPLPSVSEIERQDSGAFRVLISTLISLRTKDEVTFAASTRLFEKANTPGELIKLSEEEISSLIYPAGFYRNKAVQIHKISSILLDKYGGEVPHDKDELMALPGVGLKTTNLVLSKGLGIPAICVDIHVHRISNRMGWVKTKQPDDTEEALQKILPLKYWILINELLVLYGQQICRPVSPFCSLCPLQDECPRTGVEKHR